MALIQAMRDLWWLSRSHHRSIALACLGVAIMAGCSQVSSFLYKWLFEAMDLPNKTEGYNRGVWLIIGYAIQHAVYRQTDYRVDKCILKIRTGLRRKICEEVQKHLSRLSLSYHERSQTGKDMKKIQRGISATIYLVDRWVWMGVSTCALVAFSIFSLLFISPLVAGLLLLILPMMIGISMYFCKKGTVYREAHNTAEETATNLMSQATRNMATVQVFNQQARIQTDLAGHFDEYTDNFCRQWRYDVRSVYTRGTFIGIIMTTILWFSLWEMTTTMETIRWLGLWQMPVTKLTKGDFVLILLLSRAIIDHMWMFCQVIDETGRESTALQRLREIWSIKSDVDEAPKAYELPEGPGHIRFNNVTVQYQGLSTPALENFSVDIPPGTLMAVVGPSGGGKSTFVGCALRSRDVAEGSITIDDHDIRDLKFSYRRLFGCVLQPPQLFDDTIANNIAFGYPEATLEEIQGAARIAQLATFIERLPEGYQTRIGENGMLLSTGQQQRLIIARAILGNPKILILDEATSNLDSESESAFQEALRQIRHGRTVIVIAHRLSTIRHADQILVVHDGRIIERGTHDSLLAHNGVYHRLQTLQHLGAIDQGQLV